MFGAWKANSSTIIIVELDTGLYKKITCVGVLRFDEDDFNNNQEVQEDLENSDYKALRFKLKGFSILA